MKPEISGISAGTIRLALAMVLALLVVPGYVAAPVLFADLDSRALAGRLAGAMFHIGNQTILILLFALAAFWWRRAAGRWRWGMLFFVTVAVALNEFGLRPVMEHLKQAMGSIDAVPVMDPMRRAFGMWHGISAILHLLASLAATGLVALGWERSGEAQCRP